MEGPKATWVSNIDEIDQETMQDARISSKNQCLNLYDMSREEYMNKNDNDKKALIVKFFNQMSEGTILLFVSLLFEFWSLITMISVSPVFVFINFCSVYGLLSSLSVTFCSVSVALPAADSLLSMSEFSESMSVSIDSLPSVK